MILPGGTVEIAAGGTLNGTITFDGAGGSFDIDGPHRTNQHHQRIHGRRHHRFLWARHRSASHGQAAAGQRAANRRAPPNLRFPVRPNDRIFPDRTSMSPTTATGGTLIFIDPTLTPVTTPGRAVSSVTVSGPDITNGSGDLNAGHVVTLHPQHERGYQRRYDRRHADAVAERRRRRDLFRRQRHQALTFTYTVANGENTPDLAITAVNLNGGTAQDANGHDADLPARSAILPAPCRSTPRRRSLTASTCPARHGCSASASRSWRVARRHCDLLGRPGSYDANATAALHDPTKAVFDFSSSGSGGACLRQATNSPASPISPATRATVDLATAVHTNPVFAVLLVFTEIAAEYAAGHSQVEEAGNQQAAGLFHLLV